MSARTVDTEQARQTFIRYVEGMKLPFVATVEPGRKRTLDQNKLQRLWLNEIAHQLPEHTAEEWRGYCKLHVGVPIMRMASDEFCEVYDRVIRPMDYEHKIQLMMVPLDLPVTRLMNTKQHKEYLDTIYREFAQRGMVLTDPEMMGMAA